MLSSNPLEKNAKKVHIKEDTGRKLMHTVVKVTFLLTLFCRMSFFATSSDSKSASNSAFLIQYCNFGYKFFFFIILALFTNFEVKHGQNGSKKTKNVLCKCVLELKFATIQRSGRAKSLKSLYSNVYATPCFHNTINHSSTNTVQQITV
jgi:hypothetical protein